jgi:quinol monooxygenase YgiN
MKRITMTYVVIARYRARQGSEKQVGESLRNMLEPTRAEIGNLRYDVYRDPQDEAAFVLCEEYTDEAAFQAHLGSAHFERWLRQGTLPFLAQRHRHDLVPLEA